MYPKPLQEKEVYKFKDMTLLLFKGKIYQLIATEISEEPRWMLLGSRDNYSLFLEDLADDQYEKEHQKRRPKEMRNVSF